jgi:PPOX class probable F420-dependent enzyme
VSPSDLPADVRARLVTEQVAWLTTLRPDGSPHVTPVWFVVLDAAPDRGRSGARWWVATGAANVKVQNLRGDPRVALALGDGDRPVVVEGRAELHDRALPDDAVRAFADKYDGWDVLHPEPDGTPRLLVEITVTRWLLRGAAR